MQKVIKIFFQSRQLRNLIFLSFVILDNSITVNLLDKIF